MRKRSQNHFRLHFTSKTPYSFDTRGILSTPACDVHGRLKITTSKATKKITSIYDKKYNSTKHLKGLQFFIYEDVNPENPESQILSHQ